MDDLLSLPNVGKVLAGNLRAVGIETPEQLRETGAKDRGNLDGGQEDFQ